MLLQQNVKIGALVAVLLLGGCASAVFPDFEDNSDVVIGEGGQIEVRKVNEKGILVADKDNALYEDEDEDISASHEPKEQALAEDEVTPAKVVAVKADELEPIIETPAKTDSEQKSQQENAGPSMHYLAATVYFENGGAVVDSSYQSALRKVADIAKKNNAVVTVYGFASSRTRDTDPASHKLANFKVSAERAENTAKALRRAGVKSDKILVQALSDSMPLYQEVMPEGERLNRRAEVYLTY